MRKGTSIIMRLLPSLGRWRRSLTHSHSPSRAKISYLRFYYISFNCVRRKPQFYEYRYISGEFRRRKKLTNRFVHTYLILAHTTKTKHKIHLFHTHTNTIHLFSVIGISIEIRCVPRSASRIESDGCNKIIKRSIRSQMRFNLRRKLRHVTPHRIVDPAHKITINNAHPLFKCTQTRISHYR